MKPRNRYVVRSRISEKKFRELVRLFAMDLEATKVAALTGLNRNTVNGYFMKLRRRIAEYYERESPLVVL